MEEFPLLRSDYKLHEPFETVGTAIARWQVQPDSNQSDWGHHLEQAKKGKHRQFKCDINTPNVPNWDQDEKKILGAAAELNPERQKTTFRLSIDVSEVCPKAGDFKEEVMAKYVRTLARCHFFNLEPMVTLNHWTMPKTFAKLDANDNIVNGPLEHPDIVEHFAFFADKVADFLCDPAKIKAALKGEDFDENFIQKLCDERLICKWFITINEPFNMVFSSYLSGDFLPHQKNQFGKYNKLVDNLRAIHRILYETFHNRSQHTQVPQSERSLQIGMTHTVNDTNGVYIPGFEEFVNWGLIEQMEHESPKEYMGIQYYCRIRLWDVLAQAGLVKRSDPRQYCDHPEFGTIDPEGVYRTFKTAQDKFPDQNLMLSEFGAADNNDQRRPYWILETLRHLIRAKQDGVNIKGVLLWSLIDNWEWIRGMSPRFGLLNHQGKRLESDNDNEEDPSSRLVWKHATAHMMDPTVQRQKKLIDLRAAARKKFDRYCEKAA